MYRVIRNKIEFKCHFKYILNFHRPAGVENYGLCNCNITQNIFRCTQMYTHIYIFLRKLIIKNGK